MGLLQKSELKQEVVAKRLIKNLAQCDPTVQQDILRRCSDWISSGGDLNDQYIINQLEFTERYLDIIRIKANNGEVDNK